LIRFSKPSIIREGPIVDLRATEEVGVFHSPPRKTFFSNLLGCSSEYKVSGCGFRYRLRAHACLSHEMSGNARLAQWTTRRSAGGPRQPVACREGNWISAVKAHRQARVQRLPQVNRERPLVLTVGDSVADLGYLREQAPIFFLRDSNIPRQSDEGEDLVLSSPTLLTHVHRHTPSGSRLFSCSVRTISRTYPGFIGPLPFALSHGSMCRRR